MLINCLNTNGYVCLCTTNNTNSLCRNFIGNITIGTTGMTMDIKRMAAEFQSYSDIPQSGIISEENFAN